MATAVRWGRAAGGSVWHLLFHHRNLLGVCGQSVKETQRRPPEGAQVCERCRTAVRNWSEAMTETAPAPEPPAPDPIPYEES